MKTLILTCIFVFTLIMIPTISSAQTESKDDSGLNQNAIEISDAKEFAADPPAHGTDTGENVTVSKLEPPINAKKIEPGTKNKMPLENK